MHLLSNTTGRDEFGNDYELFLKDDNVPTTRLRFDSGWGRGADLIVENAQDVAILGFWRLA